MYDKQMRDSETIGQFVRDLISGLPPLAGEMREEFERNTRAGLESLLQKMNLVSREEYDIQVALLERLQQRVAELEQRLKEAESERTPPRA